MNSSKQLKWGMLLSYASIALNIISGLLYTPWMVNTIGQSQFGLYTLVNSLITLFLVDFGLSAATGRYLSKYHAEGNQEAAERFLGAVYKLYLIVDGIIFAILTVCFFFLEHIYINLTPGELEQLRVIYVIAGLFSVINFPFVTFNGILTAYEKFIPLKIADVIYRILIVGLTVAALLLGMGLYALVSVHAIVGLIVLLFKFVVIKKTIPLRIKFQGTPKGIYKEIFGFSLWVTISSLALRLIFNITPSILGIVASAATIAVFGVVTTLEGYTYLITNAIDGMFLPKVSKIMAADNYREKLNSLFFTVGKFQFAVNGLIVAGFAVVGQSFIRLWMGPQYQEAYMGALFILVPGLFYYPLQIANTTIVVMNKVKFTAFVHIATGVLNVILSFPLSKYFGAVGACASICIAYIFRNIVFLILYHKILPLDIAGFFKICYCRMLIPLLLTVLLGIAMNLWIADSGWFVFLLKAGITALAYFVLVLLLGFSKDEKGKIIQMIRRK